MKKLILLALALSIGMVSSEPASAKSVDGYYASTSSGATQTSVMLRIPGANGSYNDNAFGTASNYYFSAAGSSYNGYAIQAGVSEIKQWFQNLRREYWYAYSNAFAGQGVYTPLGDCNVPVGDYVRVHIYSLGGTNWCARFLDRNCSQLQTSGTISTGFLVASTMGFYVASETQCSTANTDGTYCHFSELHYYDAGAWHPCSLYYPDPHIPWNDAYREYEHDFDHVGTFTDAAEYNDSNAYLGMYLKRRF